MILEILFMKQRYLKHIDRFCLFFCDTTYVLEILLMKSRSNIDNNELIEFILPVTESGGVARSWKFSVTPFLVVNAATLVVDEEDPPDCSNGPKMPETCPAEPEEFRISLQALSRDCAAFQPFGTYLCNKNSVQSDWTGGLFLSSFGTRVCLSSLSSYWQRFSMPYTSISTNIL